MSPRATDEAPAGAGLGTRASRATRLASGLRPTAVVLSLYAAAVAVALAAPVAAIPATSRTAAAREVRYWRAERVETSFEKGAVLYAEPAVPYMIHTSRRTEAGLAEVHADDTDLIHVLEGSAVFVTGGTVLEPKTTGDGEIRGRAIEGGVTRMLSPGDVIIVPNGVPHWFKDVRGPVRYYTVKVR